MLVVAGGAVATVVGAIDAPDLFGSTETDQLRERLELLEDSLTLARAQLATDDESVGDSLFDALPGAAIPLPADAAPAKSVASRLSARKPASRAERTTDANGVPMSPRSLEGLPVIGRLASTFSRSRRHPVLHIRRPHLGVDIAAPRGTHIIAPAPGTVSFVGRKFGFGIVVEIEHGGGIRTRYAHLTKAMVQVGDEVGKGAFIATVGSTGITTGPHLHYEVLVNGRQVDPLRYRLPQPVASEGEPGAATGAAPVQPEAAVIQAPGMNPFAAPAPDSHEITIPGPVAPAPF
jgi:murein DD-endopeptidase MepM/ murein hydrolase activator NlpD